VIEIPAALGGAVPSPTNALKKARVCFTGTSGKHFRYVCGLYETSTVNPSLSIQMPQVIEIIST